MWGGYEDFTGGGGGGQLFLSVIVRGAVDNKLRIRKGGSSRNATMFALNFVIFLIAKNREIKDFRPCNLHSIFQLRFILKDYFLTGRYIKCSLLRRRC